MKKKDFEAKIAFIAGVASFTVGLALIYQPLVFLFFGALCFASWIGMVIKDE